MGDDNLTSVDFKDEARSMDRCNEDVALFDMDGTLCDYETALLKSLEPLKSPMEDSFDQLPDKKETPPYLKARMDLIRNQTQWWTGLEPLELGMDIWHAAADIGYRPMILTQGPRSHPKSWMAKKLWIDKHLGKDVDMTITRDKGLVYGKVLIDDWPPYISRWLEWRPRGLVIMPSHKRNEGFGHSNVIRYNGLNLSQIIDALQDRYNK